ncbi:MAG: 16S rRNA (guanine(966)-N(2))-methyltransferase RsmD [Atopococcus tabaci]|uniref:16S rRNA (Guanine(966)-N(2))-methyltransferase RsmD n=1 Tax=Atopococcus tabaci TaxID=269774 RepID=A0AA43RKP5_9LACT|nr:16S rRNA (guanine(966)-N(2))-methyltransferase RsmD [Atopococcus tabaci]
MRVISGEFKGRHLEALPGEGTRPTSDKVKESLFNIIGPYFEADTVVDLFSGSGNLGIEAVSRGVTHGYLVENNEQAVRVIQENVDSLELNDRITVLNQSAQSALDYFQAHQIKINLLFLDPPYDMDVIEEILTVSLNKGILSKRAIVVCETTKYKEFPDALGDLEKIRDQKYGKTRLTIYQNTEEISGEDD